MDLTNVAKVDFEQWCNEKFKSEFGFEEFEHFEFNKQCFYYSRFFHCSIFSVDKLKHLNNNYNKEKNNDWIRIESDFDFPLDEFKCITYNGTKIDLRPIGRKTMWKKYKLGLITHYKQILEIEHLSPKY